MRGLLGRLVPRRLRGWRSLGLWQERRFWDRWLRTRGGSSPELFRALTDPSTPLAGELAALVEEMDDDEIRILDIGAGPLTGVGKTHPTKAIQVTAVDVLAEVYDELLRRHAITPLVRTLHADAERLLEFFPGESFHIVHANNCVDHMEDPLRAILEMLVVVRPGGWLYLRHRSDEAERERYVGLHQWNLNCESGRFVAWQPGRRVDLSEALASFGNVDCAIDGELVTARIFKKLC